MPGYHVGKKTYNQSKGLDEHAEKFNRDKNKFYAQWHTRGIENMTPVMLIGAK
mgnify:CR=1 FL=1